MIKLLLRKPNTANKGKLFSLLRHPDSYREADPADAVVTFIKGRRVQKMPPRLLGQPEDPSVQAYPPCSP